MLPSEGASGDQKPPSAQSWLGDELMTEFSFPGSTQNEQLLQDYGALAPLAFILNVISAGQFLQMNLPEPPFFPAPTTSTRYSIHICSGQSQGLQGCILTKLWLTGHFGDVPRQPSLA